eukprot:1754759-Prymnesium_polylepis.1
MGGSVGARTSGAGGADGGGARGGGQGGSRRGGWRAEGDGGAHGEAGGTQPGDSGGGTCGGAGDGRSGGGAGGLGLIGGMADAEAVSVDAIAAVGRAARDTVTLELTERPEVARRAVEAVRRSLERGPAEAQPIGVARLRAIACARTRHWPVGDAALDNGARLPGRFAVAMSLAQDWL